MRREPQHITRISYDMQVAGQVNRGRPRLTWAAQIKLDLAELHISEATALDRAKWRCAIR